MSRTIINSDSIAFLKTVGLFKGLSDKTLQVIYQNIEERNYTNHEHIYLKNSLSTHLYIVRYGEVMIHLGEMGEIVRFLGQGDVFAENSVLTASKHNGSALAILDSLVYILNGNFFLKLAETDKILSQNLVKLMSSRMRDQVAGTHKVINRRLVCHIPLEPIKDFYAKIRLLESIQHEAYEVKIKIINLEIFKKDTHDAVMRKITQLRKQFPVIHLYLTDEDILENVEFLILQCDHIVFWESDIHRMLNKKSVTLGYWKARIRNFEGRTVRYTDTEKKYYLENLSLGQKYFYKSETLARFLVAKTRGLALGGGGARSLAHVGLIRTLEKEKITIDYISGASMGAVIAALYARGENSENLTKLLVKFFGGLKNPFDPRIPFVSFFSGKNIRGMLKDVFGNTMIEDLPIPFVTSAVDLDTGKEHIFDRGPLWEALVCAVSLPGAFPPYFMGRKLLIDGGVLNNVPDNLLRNIGADIVLGVNVSPFRDHGLFKLLEDRKISGKSMLDGWLEYISYPPILKIMGRAMTVEGRELTLLKKNSMDLFIHFHLEEFGLFEFGSYKELIAKGEYEAMAHIEDIKLLFQPENDKKSKSRF